MSPAADTCSHVRAVAVVCKCPTLPGQAARTQPGIQVTLCGRCHLALLIPAAAPTCLWHTGVSPDASPGPGRHLYSTCPARPPLCPRLPSLALLPPGDVATAALAPGKGEVVLKQKVSHISSEGLAALGALSAALLQSLHPLQSGIRDCSCLPGCPSPLPAPSGLLPALLKLLLAQRSQWMQGRVSGAVELLLP